MCCCNAIDVNISPCFLHDLVAYQFPPIIQFTPIIQQPSLRHGEGFVLYETYNASQPQRSAAHAALQGNVTH